MNAKEIGISLLQCVRHQFGVRKQRAVAGDIPYGPRLAATKPISAHQPLGVSDRLDLDGAAAALVGDVYKYTDGRFTFGKLTPVRCHEYDSFVWSEADGMRISLRVTGAYDFLEDRTVYRFDMELLPA